MTRKSAMQHVQDLQTGAKHQRQLAGKWAMSVVNSLSDGEPTGVVRCAIESCQEALSTADLLDTAAVIVEEATRPTEVAG